MYVCYRLRASSLNALSCFFTGHFTADMSSTDELGISSRLDISLITEGPLENATVTQLDIVVLELTPHGDQDSDRLYRLYSTYITLFCQFDWRTVDDALSRVQVQRFVVRFSNCLTYVDSDKTLRESPFSFKG